LLLVLHRADAADLWPLGVADLARAYVDWPESPAVVGRTGYPALAADWLEEWRFAARWVLGSRDTAVALPPSRMWQGLPTCSGQMSLPPLAAVFAGEPERAYRAAHGLGFFDNGFGKDLNAAIVAGLAVALVTPTKGPGDQAAWDAVIGAMRRCDPYRFGAIRWTQRAVDRWLDFARRAVEGAAGRPARLFATLEKEFAANSKWEAQIPFVVTFASLEICGHHPLAALQLAMEWGHDTDSYAQLTGAFVGALHGPGIFPAAWREAVRDRLVADHGVDLDAECRFLMSLRAKARGRGLVLEG
jgi:hypothetical protein